MSSNSIMNTNAYDFKLTNEGEMKNLIQIHIIMLIFIKCYSYTNYKQLTLIHIELGTRTHSAYHNLTRNF